MVVVNHLTKAAHFIPALESWNADDLTQHFLSSVFRLHYLPDKIVSDCGATFVSRFWTAILTQLRIHTAPPTAFHPQTDGQVKQTNTILEDFLRHFSNNRQDNWSHWLPIAEFPYNNTPSLSTSHSPFFACYCFHPCFNSLTAASAVPEVDKWLNTLHNIQKDLQSSLGHANTQQARFDNRRRRPDDTYFPGDLVWLSRRHLRTARPCIKLDVRRVGPF